MFLFVRTCYRKRIAGLYIRKNSGLQLTKLQLTRLYQDRYFSKQKEAYSKSKQCWAL